MKKNSDLIRYDYQYDLAIAGVGIGSQRVIRILTGTKFAADGKKAAARSQWLLNESESEGPNVFSVTDSKVRIGDPISVPKNNFDGWLDI